MTTSWSRGKSTSIFFRLCTRAPRTAIQSCDIPLCGEFPTELKRVLYHPATVTTSADGRHAAGKLHRSVGFYGLMFVSLGSIIGSGWLLGALNAAQLAGPASILSWLLAGAMLSLLALIYAELGATYPVA